MNRTWEELERAAYLSGEIILARAYAYAIDNESEKIKHIQWELDQANDEIMQLERQLDSCDN